MLLARHDGERATAFNRPRPTRCTSTRRRPFTCDDGAVLAFKKSGSRAYTDMASEAIQRQMQQNPRVTVMTAAMCQGTKLEPLRAAFPDRFFDTGICESHTVAFAAGQAKAGLRPIVDIYSTFLQRSFDQIFQEVALQNLPVTFLLDRAGLVGPDGPTHHGAFDLGYMRLFPNMVVAAPGDEWDLVGDARLCVAARCPRLDPLSEGVGRKRRRRAGSDRARPRRGAPVGRRRHDPGLRHAAGQLSQSGRHAARRRSRRGRGQHAVSSSRWTPKPFCGRCRTVPSWSRSKKAPCRAVSAARSARRLPTPASPPRIWTGWEFPTVLSSMPIAASSWPTWGSTRRALRPPAADWPRVSSTCQARTAA